MPKCRRCLLGVASGQHGETIEMIIATKAMNAAAMAAHAAAHSAALALSPADRIVDNTLEKLQEGEVGGVGPELFQIVFEAPAFIGNNV